MTLMYVFLGASVATVSLNAYILNRTTHGAAILFLIVTATIMLVLAVATPVQAVIGGIAVMRRNNSGRIGGGIFGRGSLCVSATSMCRLPSIGRF